MHLTVADNATRHVRPARLELRLDEGDDRAPLAKHGPHRAEDKPEGDERHVDDGEIRSLGQRLRGERAGVDPLHRDDPRIRAKSVSELPVAHVDRVHAGRAAGQEDVGEAARRCADVDGNHPRGVDGERVERRDQLVRPAADPLAPGRDVQRGVERHEITGLDVVPRRVPLAHPHLAGEHERLRPRARRGEAPIDEELVEADAPRGR